MRLNYLVVITFVVSPMTIFVFFITAVMVFPKFIEIGYGMGVAHPTGIRLLVDYRLPFIWIQILLQLSRLVHRLRLRDGAARPDVATRL